MPYTGAVEQPPCDVTTHKIPAESTSLSAGAKHATNSDQSEQTGLWEAGLKRQVLKRSVSEGGLIQLCTDRRHEINNEVF